MADRSLLPVLLGLLAVSTAPAQAPEITPGGVVSSASYGSPIAPGELISIFGSNFSAGASVTINNVPAPISVLTPTQINVRVPLDLPTRVSSLTAASVVVTTPTGSSPPEVAALAGSAPGFFTADGSGCGQTAALNVTPDGALSVNSPSNSAAPGDYIALYGTGFSTALTPTALTPTVFLDGAALPSLSYAGPAPGLAGVEQINFQVPASTRTGCSIPVSVTQGWGSPTVSIAVQNGRGKCTDPPIQSYGLITLDGLFSAVFPSGPNAQPPATEAIVFAPQSAMATVPAFRAILSPAPVYPRNCGVPGITDLSAGTIQIQPPSGSPILVPPQPVGSGVSYAAALPTGFLTPGAYTISGSFGSPVPLNTNIEVGAPIQITSSFPPGTVISPSHPLTVKWTGGDARSLVRVALISGTASLYSYAHALDGSLTLSPQGLASSTEAQINVTVVPVDPKELQLPGLTGPVQITWQYFYNFGPLTLGD